MITPNVVVITTTKLVKLQCKNTLVFNYGEEVCKDTCTSMHTVATSFLLGALGFVMWLQTEYLSFPYQDSYAKILILRFENGAFQGT